MIQSSGVTMVEVPASNSLVEKVQHHCIGHPINDVFVHSIQYFIGEIEEQVKANHGIKNQDQAQALRLLNLYKDQAEEVIDQGRTQAMREFMDRQRLYEKIGRVC